jgi:hypothetical protein
MYGKYHSRIVALQGFIVDVINRKRRNRDAQWVCDRSRTVASRHTTKQFTAVTVVDDHVMIWSEEPCDRKANVIEIEILVFVKTKHCYLH